jgi:hypothetical protein
VIRSTSTGTGSGSAAYLRQFSTGAKSNGVYAKAYPSSGVHYGVWGVNNASGGAGVRGDGETSIGVAGTGGIGVYGGGGYGVFSDGDFATTTHVLDLSNGGWAGTCKASSTVNSCAFNTPFTDTLVAPVVVVTPQGDPGSRYWVSGANQSGFTLNLTSAPSSPVTFAYQVVGTLPIDAAKAAKAKAAAFN